VPAAGTFYNPCRRTPRPRVTTRPPACPLHAGGVSLASGAARSVQHWSPRNRNSRLRSAAKTPLQAPRATPPSLLDIHRQHLDRDQVDTPELCSNTLPGRFDQRAVSAALSAHGSPQPRRRRTRPYPHLHKDALLAKAVRSRLFRGIATAIHGSTVATAAGRLRTRPASPRRSGIPSRGTLPTLREVVCGVSLRPSRFRPLPLFLSPGPGSSTLVMAETDEAVIARSSLAIWPPPPWRRPYCMATPWAGWQHA
jgi:hypothetical protein